MIRKCDRDSHAVGLVGIDGIMRSQTMMAIEAQNRCTQALRGLSTPIVVPCTSLFRLGIGAISLRVVDCPFVFGRQGVIKCQANTRDEQGQQAI